MSSVLLASANVNSKDYIEEELYNSDFLKLLHATIVLGWNAEEAFVYWAIGGIFGTKFIFVCGFGGKSWEWKAKI